MSMSVAQVEQTLAEQCKALQAQHLRDLLQDGARNEALYASHDGVHVDCSRQHLTGDVLARLADLFVAKNGPTKLEGLFQYNTPAPVGGRLNFTEGRAVLHTALRAPKSVVVADESGANVVDGVHEVLSRLKTFSEAVRSGAHLGHSGKALKDVLCIGIGGSYLGVEFVHEALRTHGDCEKAATGRRLHFLANVDPIDVKRALDGFDAETTLVIVISKTFTTAETMMNARTVQQWVTTAYKGDAAAIGRHVCAVSTNLEATSRFGIDAANVFGFWDWVGGRFSVCSAVGVLPLSLQYGFEAVERFLAGAHSMDQHFRTEKNWTRNLPVLMGLVSYWNATYLRHSDVAVLPYCQALLRFPAHIQQLAMESNGKRVTSSGEELAAAGEIYFGEPGTNGQHSFYQLLHQGRVVPCEFIGFTRSQADVKLADETISNHKELMSNFFAQPDALALGKTKQQLEQDKCKPELIPHKEFPGNRPSTILMFDDQLTPERVGQLLALYEHRVAVEGFLWDINSFDQWGVELGKVLAKNVRSVFELHAANKPHTESLATLPSSTKKMIDLFLAAKPE